MRDPEEPRRPRLHRFESSKRLYQQGWDLLLTRFLLLLLNLLFYIYDFFIRTSNLLSNLMCDLNESPRLIHVLETQSLKSEGDGIWVGPLDIGSFVSS